MTESEKDGDVVIDNEDGGFEFINGEDEGEGTEMAGKGID